VDGGASSPATGQILLLTTGQMLAPGGWRRWSPATGQILLLTTGQMCLADGGALSPAHWSNIAFDHWSNVGAWRMEAPRPPPTGQILLLTTSQMLVPGSSSPATGQILLLTTGQMLVPCGWRRLVPVMGSPWRAIRASMVGSAADAAACDAAATLHPDDADPDISYWQLTARYR
jgi:hypothetical protein